MKKLYAIAIIGTMVSPVSSFAATASASFSGTVDNTCIITAGTAGRVSPNADFSNLSSGNAGGLASQVSALSTGNIFSITTDAPTGIVADTVASSYALSGATTQANTAGTLATPLAAGLTNIAVDMSATRNSGVFSSGAYNGVVTVRCE